MSHFGKNPQPLRDKMDQMTVEPQVTDDVNQDGTPADKLPDEPKGVEIVAAPESFPESVLERIRETGDSHPEIEVEVGGGLAAATKETT
jgi:hypothetical protein